MISVRPGVFETNSSSSHSIIIATDDDYVTKEEISKHYYVNNDGILRIFHEDNLSFQRYPFKILDDFYTKLCFAIASYCCYHDNPDEVPEMKEIYDTCAEVIDNFKGIEFPYDTWYDDEEEKRVKEYFYGEIDHQSYGLLDKILKKEDISIREFILNKKYIVIIDGDEYNNTEVFLNLSILNPNKVIKRYTPYGVINGISTKYPDEE